VNTREREFIVFELVLKRNLKKKKKKKERGRKLLGRQASGRSKFLRN
jgi:hypothetical protein